MNAPLPANPSTERIVSSTEHEFDVRGLSHRGLVRVHNEDAWHADSSLGLAIVADGVGGHANGALASQAVVRWISSYVRRVMVFSTRAALSEKMQQERTLGRAIAYANKRLVSINATAGDVKERCGTTIVGVWAPCGTASAATVFHVGDSRMYLLRKNARLEALTRDHSAYQQWVDTGRRGSPPPKSYILQALGLSDVAPDIISIKVAAGDRFLLCTDGLSNGVEPAEMQEVMTKSASLETACERFISLGLARGGNDNLTSVVGVFS